MKTCTYYNTPAEGIANICDMSIELAINCAGAVKAGDDISNRSVRKDYYLMYILDGSMNIEFADYQGYISAGDLLVLKPQTIYRYHTESGSFINYLWIHFTGSRAGEILNRFAIPVNIINHIGLLPNSTEYWKRLFHEFVICDNHFADVSVSVFTEILACFSRRISKKAVRSELIKSIMYIHENYSRKLSVAQLAAIEGLSESHYRAVFTKVTGESPTDYIAARRIEAAVNLLESTDKKLTEISELTGYSDAYYFGKKFKEKFGVSPGRYRRDRKC